MNDYILSMVNVTKEFPGVKALSNVNFNVRRGEIHALCGENGAGKSTLMKVLSGVYPYGAYSGEVILNNEKQRFFKIKDSEKAGVAIIYQELALVKELNISENIFLGNEFSKNGIIDMDKTYVEAAKILKEIGLNLSPSVRVGHLGIGQQQLIEIAKALTKDTDLLILDEPTAALTEAESKKLLNLLCEIKKRGVTCIIISHKLNEVFEISDSITILRDGKTVGTYPTGELNEEKLISLMVGREITDRYPKKAHTIGDVVLEVKNWFVDDNEIPNRKKINNVSFNVKKGEILGIAGLMGAGRTELFTSIFGAVECKSSGQVFLEGRKVDIKEPKDAIKEGLCYLSEDRKRFGVILDMDIKKNVTLSRVEKISSRNVINENEEIRFTRNYVRELLIKTPSIEQRVANLSGGNQQKVALAKWLMAEPKVLILDEPTRGIDVGAKFEIYNLMNMLADKGVSIIMISSELPEVLGMSDRILVLHEGKISGELKGEDATQEKIMFYATSSVQNGLETHSEVKI